MQLYLICAQTDTSEGPNPDSQYWDVLLYVGQATQQPWPNNFIEYKQGEVGHRCQRLAVYTTASQGLVITEAIVNDCESLQLPSTH